AHGPRLGRAVAGPALHPRPGRQHHAHRGRGAAVDLLPELPRRSERGLHLRLAVSTDRSNRPRAPRTSGCSSDPPRLHRAPLHLSGADGHGVGRYRERFDYDGPGNLLSVSHRSEATGDGWTRTYAYDSPSPLEPGKTSSRLTSTTIDRDTVERYEYDAHGNTVRMPHLQSMEWEVRDLLRTTSRQSGDAEHCERTWYVYDNAGRRARKVTEGANGQITH